MTLYTSEIDEICDYCGEARRCIAVFGDGYDTDPITSICQDCANDMFERAGIETEEEE